MRVTVRLFAAARERAGVGSLDVELATGASVAQLLAAVVAAKPVLASLLPHLRVAVNQEFAAADALVEEGAEVALIPPVAGG